MFEVQVFDVRSGSVVSKESFSSSYGAETFARFVLSAYSFLDCRVRPT